MSEEKLKIDDIQVSKGDTYTAETALNIRFNIYNDRGIVNRYISNPNDAQVANAQNWRESLDVKMDLSDITLQTTPEEIEQKKQAVLEQYQSPSPEELNKSWNEYEKAGKKFSSEVDVEWAYDCIMTGLKSSTEKDYDKTFEYANKLIDNIIEYHSLPDGKKSSCKRISEIESPFRSKLDKFLGRKGEDPFRELKSAPLCRQDHEENTADFIEGLKKINELFPKTAEDMEKLDFSKRSDVFDEQFKDKHIAGKERAEAEKALVEQIVQVGIKNNISKAFDSQLEEHLQHLKEEEMKNYISVKKEEIRDRLAQSAIAKQEAPVSGVVIADSLAEHRRAKQTLLDKEKELGIKSADEEVPMMTPTEGNKLAQSIQKKLAETRNSR